VRVAYLNLKNFERVAAIVGLEIKLFKKIEEATNILSQLFRTSHHQKRKKSSERPGLLSINHA